MARGSARASGTRPAWVRLGFLALLIAVLAAAMAATGNWTPRLGLDLQGGTSVTLTPRSTQAGTTVDSRAVDKAVDIIRERVNGLGVAEAEVKRQGDQIEISVPGRGRSDVVDLVGQTAELRFREVYTAAAAAPTVPTPTPTPSPTPTPTASGSVAPTSSPAATGTAAAAPTTAATAQVDPAASETTRPRPVDQSLLAAGAVPTGEPSVVASLTPAAVETSPPAADPAATAATPPAEITAAFAALTCAPSDVRSAEAATDAASDWIVACDRDGVTKYLLKPATVVGTDVKTASAGLDSTGGATGNVTTGQWQIRIEFTGDGQRKFTELTESTIGKQVAIVLDGVVQSAPNIQDRIPGDATVSGSFTQSDAEDLASVLEYGALPIAFDNESAQTISPTLGQDSLNGGLLAGAIGLGLVVIYAFLYYRALGLVVVCSLAVSAVLVYASVVLLGELIGFTLTLAGIAGLIVSIGVTADSFVVYFERIKDEVRGGRSVRASVDRAWPSARRTMLSADTVSFLAAAVLYMLSVGSVRGFAFTLGLSTLIDVLIMFIFTRPMVQLLVRRRFFGASRFSGLTASAVMGSRAPAPRPSTAGRLPVGARAGSRPSLAKEPPASQPSSSEPSSSKDRPRRAGEKREN